MKKSVEQLVRKCFCKGCYMQPLYKKYCGNGSCHLNNCKDLARAARRFVQMEQGQQLDDIFAREAEKDSPLAKEIKGDK